MAPAAASSESAPGVPGPALRRLAGLIRTAFILAWRPTRPNVLHWASWGVALSVEIGMLVLLWDGRVYGWERAVTEFLERTPERDRLFTVSNYLTRTLSLQFALFFAAVVGLHVLARRWVEASLLALTFPLHVLAQFPKALVERPRPSQYYDGYGGFMSYPSGHAEFVVTFYGLLVYFVLLRVRSPWPRAAVVSGWLLLVASVGLGRISTGRHWPLDILVSYVVGMGLLSGLVWIERSLRVAQSARCPPGSLPVTPG